MSHSPILPVSGFSDHQLSFPVLSSSGAVLPLEDDALKQRLEAILDLTRGLRLNAAVETDLKERAPQQLPRIALEQIFFFLRGKNFPEGSKIGAYLAYLREKYPALEDFLAVSMQAVKGPISMKVCRAYTHFLIKEQEGEDSLLCIAQYRGLPYVIRVAAALELSFSKNEKAITFLGYFIKREDFYEYRNYILKNVRDPKLKQALLKLAGIEERKGLY